MWGQKWGQMIWGSGAGVPAIGVWGVLFLGCFLGIAAVLLLRSARKTALGLLLLVLLVPLSALASVPFIFTNGTVADASQVNQDFAAVLPIVGRTSTLATIPSSPTYVFPSSPSFVAPRNLTCIVTIEPYVVTGSPNSMITWITAMKVGSTQSTGPTPGPAQLSLVHMPVGDNEGDNNYTSTFTEVFSVSSGSSVSFGAQFFNLAGESIVTAYVNVVYSCTTPP
jgi:hypothetical protein